MIGSIFKTANSEILRPNNLNIENKICEKQRFQHHFMLGMRLDYTSSDQFIDEFIHSAQHGISAYCCVPDVYQCVICHDNEEHRAIVNGADYVVSDSVILQNARAMRYGVPVKKTLLGSRLMQELCREAAANNIPVALIGGRDEGTLARIKLALSEDFPDLDIAYAYSPPFRPLTPVEEETILHMLSATDARLVFFGIGCPKQEQWMARYKGRINASMIGVGAAFDTIGGLVSASPEYVHRFGLEWLFRLVREPRRLYRRYLVTAPRFVLLIIADWMRSRVRGENRPQR